MSSPARKPTPRRFPWLNAVLVLLLIATAVAFWVLPGQIDAPKVDVRFEAPRTSE